MSAYAYAESALVEKAAIDLFAWLGWQPVNAFNEAFGPGGAPGSENAGEGVLTRYLVPKLRKLNFTGSADAIKMALIELAHDLLLPKLISGTVDMMVSVGPNFFYTLTLWFYDRGQAGGVRHKLQAATRYSDVQ